jgi:DNA-binding MarR family transcriptional regulator
MNYIAETLGIRVFAEPWSGASLLPFYLTDIYSFQIVTLGEVRCLFVKPAAELAALPAVKKHLTKIAEHARAPLVLYPDSLNARQRKALIAAQTAFVVEGSQLYLPFLGVALQERYANRRERRETLSPTAQMVLFHYLYQREAGMYIGGLAELLGVSAMQITRAVRQLAALELFTAHKDGVRIVVAGTENGSALFVKATPHLLNPVRRRVYADKTALPPNLPFAGLSALSEYTMLNPPSAAVYAFNGKVNELPGTNALVDADAQAEVEVWRYPPTLLPGKDGVPDPLSLWVTLADGDARVEIAKEELLAGVWRNE